MTLEQHLQLQQSLSESVLVERQHLMVDNVEHRLIVHTEIVEETHAIEPESLKLLRKIWAAQYEQWQLNQTSAIHRHRQLTNSNFSKGRSNAQRRALSRRLHNQESQLSVIRRTK